MTTREPDLSLFWRPTPTAEQTAASRDARGWVSVDDVGYLDDEGGYLFLTDRRHHMIISGGVNVSRRS